MDYDRLRELQEKYEENPRRYFAPLANEYRKGGQPKRNPLSAYLGKPTPG